MDGPLLSLWKAPADANQGGGRNVEITRVRDEPDLPLGSEDPEILRWAEREGFILVSTDTTRCPLISLFTFKRGATRRASSSSDCHVRSRSWQNGSPCWPTIGTRRIGAIGFFICRDRQIC